MLEKTARYENLCDTVHATIPEAIRCAERSLVIAPGQRMQPYWGSMQNNEGLIVGWQLGKKRWRLDYEYPFKAENKGREPWGPHINEENFELPKHLAKVVHRIAKPTLGGDRRRRATRATASFQRPPKMPSGRPNRVHPVQPARHILNSTRRSFLTT